MLRLWPHSGFYRNICRRRTGPGPWRSSCCGSMRPAHLHPMVRAKRPRQRHDQSCLRRGCRRRCHRVLLSPPGGRDRVGKMYVGSFQVCDPNRHHRLDPVCKKITLISTRCLPPAKFRRLPQPMARRNVQRRRRLPSKQEHPAAKPSVPGACSIGWRLSIQRQPGDAAAKGAFFSMRCLTTACHVRSGLSRVVGTASLTRRLVKRSGNGVFAPVGQWWSKFQSCSACMIGHSPMKPTTVLTMNGL